jgi:uncharacterized membrane protein
MAGAAKKFFTPEEQEEITRAVMKAELETSGEIRVHIEENCPGEVLDRAAHVFKTLHMHRTDLRNGVLIYLAIKHRKFAIIGDMGINKVVPSNFWDDTKEGVLTMFKQNRFREGLVFAIGSVGEHLSRFFPAQVDDTNELSNDISFGK